MKVLVVGLGSIARKHIEAIRRIDPLVSIYALRSSRNASGEDGVVNIYEIMDIPDDIDFIIISNPTSCHAPAIDELKHLGKPLFIEKPVFESLSHAGIIEEIRELGITTYVACNLRFLDSVVFLKKYIEENPGRRINEVDVYCGSYLPEWRPGSDFRKCYSAIPEMGGGVHIDLIHEIDYVYWLFGAPKDVKAICRSVSSLGIRSIDYANYSLVYPDFVASIILNYYRRDYRRTLEILFDDGSWIVNLKSNTIHDEKGEVIFAGEKGFSSTYESQMRYFINLVKSGGKSGNDIDSAYNVLKICLNHEGLD